MTPEKQRIAIAGACGWTGIQQGNNCQGKRLLGVSPANKGRTSYDGVVLSEIPDYLNDLNAMHEVEAWLLKNRQDMRLVYRRLLIEACGDSPNYWHTTAAQRAEAFLRTLNLWIED